MSPLLCTANRGWWGGRLPDIPCGLGRLEHPDVLADTDEAVLRNDGLNMVLEPCESAYRQIAYRLGLYKHI